MPFLGAKVRTGHYNEFKKHHILVIDFKGKLQVVLQALSDIDRDEWINGILEYQKKSITSEENYKQMELNLSKGPKKTK